MEGCERGRVGRGEAIGLKESRGRLRRAGREEGSRSKRDMWKAEREAGREEGRQAQKRHVEG